MAASKIQIKVLFEFCGKEFIVYKVTTRYYSKSCNAKTYKLIARFKQVAASEKELQEAIRAKPLNDIAHKEYLSPHELQEAQRQEQR